MSPEQRDTHEATILDSLTILSQFAPMADAGEQASLKCIAYATGCEARAQERIAPMAPEDVAELDQVLARAVELLGEGD